MPEIKKKPKTYRAVVGIEDSNGSRYEPGEKVPASLVADHGWLLDSGKVRES